MLFGFCDKVAFTLHFSRPNFNNVEVFVDDTNKIVTCPRLTNAVNAINLYDYKMYFVNYLIYLVEYCITELQFLYLSTYLDM